MWRTFRPSWPTLPGSGRQRLDGSISLKFLLETRLQKKVFMHVYQKVFMHVFTDSLSCIYLNN